MYRKVEQAPSPPFDFEFPWGKKLAEDNRWAIRARLILWSEFEAEYAQNFAERGAPAKSFRLALGALIIKEKLGISEPWNSRRNSRQPLFTILARLGDLQQRTAIWPIHHCSFTLRQRISVSLVNKVNQKMVLFGCRSFKQLSITLNTHNALIKFKGIGEVIAWLIAVTASLIGVDDFRTIWG